MFWSKKKKLPVVPLSGVISATGKNSLNLNKVKDLIDSAFDMKKAPAVALMINSPGGSAAQSEIIANYIRSKANSSKKKVIAFVQDVAASGGYFIATAADEIIALANTSIVGSIGVLYSGFGLSEFIHKHGIERRLYTAGENKVLLDTFSKPKKGAEQFIDNLLAKTHAHFKNFVLGSRVAQIQSCFEQEARLNPQSQERKVGPQERGNAHPEHIEDTYEGYIDYLFSGKFWLASEALSLGLIDDVVVDYEGHLKSRYGKKIKLCYLKGKKGFFSGLLGLKNSEGSSLAEEISTQITETLKETLNAGGSLLFRKFM